MGSICHGYMCIVLYMKLIWCNGFPEIYAQLEEGWGQSIMGICELCYMSQAWKRVQKRDNEVRTLHNIWDLRHGCQQMCRQTMAVLLCMCSGFPTKILEQMIVTSLYDVTRVSHAIVGGNYKRRA